MNADSAALLRARYRREKLPSIAESPVIRTLMAHRSVRAYLPDPLPEGALEAAIAAAQSAATSSNLQCWSVVAVEDAARKARLAELCGHQKHIVEAPLFLAWIADLSRLERIAEAQDSGRESLDYLEMFMVALIDTALAAQNAVAAFESLGLGTVYIGGLRNHPVEVAKELHLPPLSVGAFGLCVGAPDPAHPADIKPRLPQAAVLHREHYDAAREAELIAQYDADANQFQIEQGLPERAWSSTMARRIAGLRGLSGRDVMRAALETLGFALK
ncbi:nitroreductase family protein [Acidomonas methanolica]|uniref:Nitroreductase n=1 Tax=Acidomonas methanolica NBRC 104435 TaxID=1231351 RepID=A0A023D7Z0_ACIMT|nr:nitroreductase family protein [Acidomonas methanolica]MBU2655303.1 nitroreductase family protein [Acidomonas methanolica]MCQ9155839.1 nitroreductase family protein [Acidomonas methanolica]TCS23796.1 nitroreductase [Acidomonas methanolica]GAJ29860.1 nitroreductase [Acidomonas methanolica NBRC 104435]GBQ53199.1 nitroreductase [Acidomonas methanolica]